MFSHTEPKIVVLQFNFFQPRVLAEDMEDLLLDAAWGVVDFPSRSIDDIIHFSVNGALNNPGRPPRPVYGKEEVELAYGEKKKETIRVSAPQLANHLRRLLLSLDPNADIVFLTHDVYNLSRAFCHLGLQDLYPQAATTKNNWRLYYGILNSSNDWEGIGALVGYPERVPIQQKGNTAMKPDPGRSSTASDASRASSRYDSREPSTTPSSRYGSASPMPDSRMSRDTTLVPGTQSRGSSIYSDRYDERSNREYSRGVSTKQEPYENERDRSRSQLFRPRSRSPSSRPSSSVSSRYTSATSVPPVQGEEEKFAPLGQELFVPLKHELPLKNPIKNEDEKKPFVGQTPTGGFAGAPRRTFVLDTQVLYGTSARTWSDLHPLHTVAVAMGLREEDQGICAAYELVDIWDIASRLLSGPPVLFIKGFIDEDVKVKKAEEEYYKLEEQGPPPEDTQSTSHQGGMFGVPYSKPKRDFYDVVFEDDDDDY
ncbi:hypothetical protein DACRYDRAFT_119226 [Dacryopinax primogenitus]|uniref:Uncharacterized protein n=1 Tax=Dacryopinax primogenitus (strain DJM 731) TaxID=1858805 RepID=M5FRE2_DACPD|nr:uncharacterized protein DACRYDRAFT_119226 [Dacryopinax primogenitus]EJT97544.1 hypothetical protein DACRYDRAFT_119226 [Dacryopinax primogenitus]